MIYKNINAVIMVALTLILFSSVSDAGGDHGGGNTPSVHAELFNGEGGYIHAGIGAEIPLVHKWKLNLNVHTVKEETGSKIFPSIGAGLEYEFSEALSLGGFGFHYIEVDETEAMAFGIRFESEVMHFDAFGDYGLLSLLFSPVFGDYTAIDEDTELPVDLNHKMLFFKATVDTKKFSWSVFGNKSWFSGDVVELETWVDLAEMTRTAVYDNNDGFARSSVGTEFTVYPSKHTSLLGGVVRIDFPGLSTRYSYRTTLGWKSTKNLELELGYQRLKGGERVAFGYAWYIVYFLGAEKSGESTV